MMRLCALLAIMLVLAFVPLRYASPALNVGSKKFTESVILGDMIAQLTEQKGTEVTHHRELGGTRLVFDALLKGDLDIYPEYTGTISEELFGGEELSEQGVKDMLASQGVGMSAPLGFNNTYALGMLASRARELEIETISDLRKHPELKLGFSNEFLDRADGWPQLRSRYSLPQRSVAGMDHNLAYVQLSDRAIDVVDVYTTDARIERLGLKVLEDDLHSFPRYDAVLLYRLDLKERFPEVWPVLQKLEGIISENEMLQANSKAELERIPEPQVAADLLAEQLGVTIEVRQTSVVERIAENTIDHLDLVRRSLLPAVLLAIPLGIWAAKRPRWGQVLLASVGLVQTIPSLALLVLVMPVVAAVGLSSIGVGSATAVVALFLYSLLPIVRNTHAGLVSIPTPYRESAAALGLTSWQRLTLIELPLASPGILAGIKTAAVINVGFATLGALVGAGGYGQPILTGIRLNNTSLILQGAIPAAVLALLVQGGFELAERFVVPRGLRLATAAH